MNNVINKISITTTHDIYDLSDSLLCSSLCLFVTSNLSEESKQQSSELSEQLKLSTQENGAMRLEVEDLSKRLEIADLMLQQVG